jgi:hypothetical protein
VGRNVTVVLIDPAGDPIGVLPPFHVEVPWWPGATEIVDAVRERHGAEITVLRLIRTEPGPSHGGRVTYLASTDKPVADAAPLTADDVPELADHPLRAPWARPGGPEEILAWARERMAAAGRPVLGVVQERTWNLSAIWRLETATGPTWLKVVPPFFAHEPAVLTWLHRAVPGRAPVPLVAEPGRVIMDRVSGDDRHDAPADERLPMVRSLVRIQAAALGALDELRAHAVPSLDLADLKLAAIDVIDRRGGEASRRTVGEPPADALAALDRLIDGLDDRIAAIAACGVPTTLTHGDFHAGNVRVAAGGAPVILDWGDSVLTHPGFDLLRIREGLPGDGADAVTSAWSAEWRAAVPDCDPERAVDLLGPLAELRNAVMYAGFLDGIEPSEWPYHARDVLPPLLAAANLAGVPG